MILDKESRKIMRCFISQKEPLSMEQLLIFTSSEANNINECIEYLLSNELIEMVQCDVSSSVIEFFQPTRKGRTILESESNDHLYLIFNEFRAWVTLLIAVSAFILSIVMWLSS